MLSRESPLGEIHDFEWIPDINYGDDRYRKNRIKLRMFYAITPTALHFSLYSDLE